MRLFVAIELSDEMKKAAIKILHDLKEAGVTGSFTPVQNLHLTLCFIGEMPDSKPVEDALSTVKFKPFKLDYTETGHFGDLLYVATRGGQGINSLASDIRKALDNAGIEYDRKKFTPHITLIRRSAGKAGKIAIPDTSMMVKKVSLMRSDNVNGKMVYKEIYHIS
ncbi:MAG: RNA 2',3'-cyclic phosphodiesterase [Lachnospiraceae bacterium]|nr:RNA 2',3'-cyclic phosphodiesterase [Lachnospiraceae bacterium]